MPVISQKELEKLQNKQGVYSKLTRNELSTREKEQVVEKLKPLVIELVERAFRAYAKAHNADDAMVTKEWKRFKRFLEKEL